MSNSHVTTLAAIQLVIMHAITSFILKKALSRPGIMPHSAPAAMPPKNASVHISQPGTLCVGMPSAMNSVAAVPARYCPGAPMLNRPVLNATATESPVSISGVARNSMLPTLAGLNPNVSAPAASRPVLNRPMNTSLMPSHMLWPPSVGSLRPTAIITSAPAARPMIIDISEASTLCVPAFAIRPVFLPPFMRAPPSSAVCRPPCTVPILQWSHSWDQTRPRSRPQT